MSLTSRLLQKGKKQEKVKEQDKVKAISCNVLWDTSANKATIRKYLENVDPSDLEERFSRDSDILIDMHLDQKESHGEESSCEEEAENEFQELVKTRSNRVAGTWGTLLKIYLKTDES